MVHVHDMVLCAQVMEEEEEEDSMLVSSSSDVEVEEGLINIKDCIPFWHSNLSKTRIQAIQSLKTFVSADAMGFIQQLINEKYPVGSQNTMRT
jgi:hypothetical protein